MKQRTLHSVVCRCGAFLVVESGEHVVCCLCGTGIIGPCGACGGLAEGVDARG